MAGAGNAAEGFVGRWRIASMECRDADYLDMEVAAYITLKNDLTGEFQFGLVQGQMEGRIGAARYRFTWSGFDENDPVSGRGWLRADGQRAEGRIEFYLGETSKLMAYRQ